MEPWKVHEGVCTILGRYETKALFSYMFLHNWYHAKWKQKLTTEIRIKRLSQEVRIAYKLKYVNYILISKDAKPKSISPIPLAEQSQAFVETLYLWVGTLLLYTDLGR